MFNNETLIFMLRIFLAGLCGIMIGHERQSRRKQAGLRTHAIVAVAAALMMIISKHGFDDVVNDYIKLDPSRVAAGIVTAVGFIGSGIIVFKHNSVNGITTSAGIWGTVGVGMALGSGLYVLGIFTAILIVLAQLFLARSGIMNEIIEDHELSIGYDKEELYDFIMQKLKEHHISISSISLKKREYGFTLSMNIKTDESFKFKNFYEELRLVEGINSLSLM